MTLLKEHMTTVILPHHKTLVPDGDPRNADETNVFTEYNSHLEQDGSERIDEILKRIVTYAADKPERVRMHVIEMSLLLS